MGGLAPGIGGFELVVIALVALLVVGPKDLPLLMRKVGRALGKARAMANEFRASFDEMARQSELDELRKEVEALRTGQAVKLGPEADAAFKDIRDDLARPLDAPAPKPALPGPVDTPVVQAADSAAAAPKPDAAPARTSKPLGGASQASKPKAAKTKPASKAAKPTTKKSPAKPRKPRKTES